MEYRLDFVLNDEQKFFSLKKKEITIGKLPGNDFYLEDNSISRKHCKLTKDGDTYKLEDLNSTKSRSRI